MCQTPYYDGVAQHNNTLLMMIYYTGFGRKTFIITTVITTTMTRALQIARPEKIIKSASTSYNVLSYWQRQSDGPTRMLNTIRFNPIRRDVHNTYITILYKLYTWNMGIPARACMILHPARKGCATKLFVCASAFFQRRICTHIRNNEIECIIFDKRYL